MWTRNEKFIGQVYCFIRLRPLMKQPPFSNIFTKSCIVSRTTTLFNCFLYFHFTILHKVLPISEFKIQTQATTIVMWLVASSQPKNKSNNHHHAVDRHIMPWVAWLLWWLCLSIAYKSPCLGPPKLSMGHFIIFCCINQCNSW